MNEELDKLRQQLLQLKALHDQGVLDDAGYAQSRAPLERKLVDAVTAPGAAAAPVPGSAAAPAATTQAATTVAAATATSAARPSRAMWAGVSSLVLALAAAGYAWTGSPQFIAGAPPAPATPAGHAQQPNAEQIAAMVDKLAQRLKEQPEDAQGWTMLARAYAVLGRTDEAVPAYERAVALRSDDASLLADYADVLAVRNGRRLDGEPMKLVARALQVDPNNPKALALAGTAAFDNKDFATAVMHWEKLLQAVPPGSEYHDQVRAGIDEARQLGKLPPAAATVAATGAAAAPPAGAAPGAAEGASVSGSVALAPALAARTSPTDTVFVFARAAEGPRMPLAVLRKQVKDLPFDFALDDSMAMSPAAKLSGAAKVVVGVRISKTGEAMPQDGDLTGESPAVAPGAKGLKIEIAEVVKK